jgi:hypothetical protein
LDPEIVMFSEFRTETFATDEAEPVPSNVALMPALPRSP